MSKEEKKISIIKITQIFIYFVSIMSAFLYRGAVLNWPFYLLLVGILIGFLIPTKYRSGFLFNEPGFLLKNHTRGQENIAEMVITCIAIVLVVVLNMF